MMPLSGLVQAEPAAEHSHVMVEQGWIRHAPPGAPVRAGYGRIENHGSGEVIIDSAFSDVFGAVEIHEMLDVDGVMQMRPLSKLVLAAGEGVSLEPGGLHLMLYRPLKDLEPGTQLHIRFNNGDAQVADGMFVVRDSADDEAHDHDHAEHHAHEAHDAPHHDHGD